MSDKSFGDHMSRGMVKNPLLSTAVTGLSIDDLTQNAVLLPVSRTQALLGGQEQTGTQNYTLAHSNTLTPNIPSGDANFTPIHPTPPPDHTQTQYIHQQNAKNSKTIENAHSTASNAPVKSEDDFDVNEYFARLQGTRYVSAPLNSHLKEDANANLEDKEENLEEINLNEPEKGLMPGEHQSITADIAQNFSQLPTVLPQVASAVFSSFSNMLSMKSREHTPDEVKYQHVEIADVGVPLMGVSEAKEVAPPPKEPPVCGPGNFRMTSKKKIYAQIPGLSSGETVQMPTYTPPAFNQQYYTPPPQTSVNFPNLESNIPREAPQVNVDSNVFNTVQNIPDDVRPNVFEGPKEEVKPIAPAQFNPPEFNPQAPIIPPPPMFSNLAKRDSVPSSGKSVLPPSVYRRISNKPTANTPAFTNFGNIFVPAPIPSEDSQLAPTFPPNPSQTSFAPPLAQPNETLAPTFPPNASQTSFAPPLAQANQTLAPTFPPNASQTSFVPPLAQPAQTLAPTFPPIASQTSFVPPTLAQPNQAVPTSSHPPVFTSQGPPSQPGFKPASSASMPPINVPSAGTLPPPPTNASIIQPPTNVPSSAGIPSFAGNLPPPPTHAAFTSPNASSKQSSILPQPPTFTAESQSVLPPSIFTPGHDLGPKSVQSEPGNIPPFASESVAMPPLILASTPAPIFNPYPDQISSGVSELSSAGTSEYSGQYSILDPRYTGPAVDAPPQGPKLPEPPKASGNTNFRMTKKRPQYYAGPIEGIGAISNNVKPTLAPVATTAFQGALFTPETGAGYQGAMFTPEALVDDANKAITPVYHGAIITPEAIVEKASIDAASYKSAMFSLPEQNIPAPNVYTFDINQQAEPVTYTPFDINEAPETTAYNPNFNTAFDTSRQTDNYEPPKESAFGIIGSLKSKLSSLDINKIQNSVTTFFDPAYNNKPEVAKEYEANKYAQAQSGIEIFVPNVETTHAQPYNYDAYHANFTYGQGGVPNPTNYYQQQVHNVYSPESYYTQPAYGTQNYTQEIPVQQYNQAPNVGPFDTVAAGFINPGENNANMASYTSPAWQSNIVNYKDDNVLASKEYEKSDAVECEVLTDVAQKQAQEEIEQVMENLQIEDEPEANLKQIDLAAHDNVDKSLEQQVYKFDTPPSEDGTKDFNIDDAFGATEKRQVNFYDSFAKDDDTEDGRKKIDEMTSLFSMPLRDLSSELASKSQVIYDGVSSDDGDQLSKNSDDEKNDYQTISASITLGDSGDEDSFKDDKQHSSDLNICETCREVSKPGEKVDLTSKLIENITSPIQLLNPVEVPFTESGANLPADFDTINQCAEISLIADETVETLQVQSATELLDDEKNTNTERNYGWRTESAFPPGQDLLDPDYTFKPNPNAIGFFGDNNLFFDNIPTNASDEIKAEFKVSQDEAPIILQRQMSIPTAPPLEDSDDAKSDETGVLDVQSIEQDASKDFPVFEEFVIEPSETDDDKLETNKTDEVKDTFTNRVDRFKKLESSDDLTQHKDFFGNISTIMPSYFDTGNYAVETHYKNSLTSPTFTTKSSESAPLRIPPGFENEYGRKTPDRIEPKIPETYTQTPTTTTSTFSAVRTTATTTVASKTIAQENTEMKLPDFASVFGAKIITDDITTPSDFIGAQMTKAITPEHSAKTIEVEAFSAKIFTDTPIDIFGAQITNKTTEVASIFGAQILTDTPIDASAQITKAPEDFTVKPDDIIKEIVQEKKIEPLPDPINFFASATQETNATEGLNRLASYFASPPKTETTKSFFELSQGQDHYRQKDKDGAEQKPFFELSQSQDHYKKDAIPHDKYIANLNLMKDLTSFQNMEPSNDQVVRTVNHFTVEYDDDTLNYNKGEPSTNNKPINKNSEKTKIEETLTDNVETLKDIVNNCKYCSDLQTGPILIFKELETLGKPGFRQAMNSDSDKPKEEVNMQPKKEGERTINVKMEDVSPDGDNNEGVAMMSENRSSTEYEPVKHHWFYRVDWEGKSTWRGFSIHDSKAIENAFHSPDLHEGTLVPTDGGRFDVNVMGRLRIAVYWADKPTNVRRCSWFYKGTTDARYVPYTEPVAEKLEEEYRHGITTGEWHRRLVLPNSELVVMHGPAVMVHFLHSGGADAFSAPNQSTMRPRVVRRGFDESEIEDMEPSNIDHLLLMCHGVGSACDMRFRSVEEVVDDFRATSLQLLQSHYRNSCDAGVVGRVEVLPISWHTSLHAGPRGVDRRLARVTLASIPRLRAFTNDTVLDVLFYTSPHYCQSILNTVCGELNRVYTLFKARNPNFKGDVSLGGHSLGSVILYDLLCHQDPPTPMAMERAEKEYLTGTADHNPTMKYPKLCFEPLSLYALGSPIAIFECIRGVESLGSDFVLPTCRNFFNIFHPYDPIAYRIEPLVNPQLQNVKPSLIPHHKGRKRMHLELKETMARVGADLKQKLMESIKSTWSSMWASTAPPPDHQLEKVVEEEIEKEQMEEVNPNKEEVMQTDVATGDMLGKLNNGRRVDYVLQEAPFEMINEYLFAMSSHVCYWESEDTMLLILREIYDSLGVQADVTVPQQSMTVQRTAAARSDEKFPCTEVPSTSRTES